MGALGYAILGLLARESLTGYDLMRWMQGMIGFFWQARHSQIYPELARLEAEGMVVHRVVEQQDRPDKKVYTITTAGLEALKEWASKPPAARPTRDELVLKAYSLWVAEPGAALTLFREQEKLHEERLQKYEEIEAWMEKEWGRDLEHPASPRFASYATLQRGILNERGYMEWCRWVADRLQNASSKNAAGDE